jgi:hypothetical protein
MAWIGWHWSGTDRVGEVDFSLSAEETGIFSFFFLNSRCAVRCSTQWLRCRVHSKRGREIQPGSQMNPMYILHQLVHFHYHTLGKLRINIISWMISNSCLADGMIHFIHQSYLDIIFPCLPILRLRHMSTASIDRTNQYLFWTLVWWIGGVPTSLHAERIGEQALVGHFVLTTTGTGVSRQLNAESVMRWLQLGILASPVVSWLLF